MDFHDRSEGRRAAESRLLFEPFCLDLRGERLWHGARAVALTPKAFAVLRHLACSRGALVTKGEILDAVWPDTYVTDGVLKQCIREIRSALGDAVKTPRFIETVHRRGYRFVAPVKEGHEGSTARRERGKASAGLVGRDASLASLHGCFARALEGDRQVVFVSGEAGIGKTALIDAFVAQLRDAHRVRIGHGQCLEHYGSGEAYLPVLEALGALGKGADAGAIAHVLRQHAPTWLAQLPWLVTDADRVVLEREIRGATRERMLREMASAVEALAAEQPLLIVLEDLHWSDPSTLDLISLLARRREPSRFLLLASYRPVDVIVSQHPLKPLKQDLDIHRLCVELSLELLRLDDVREHLSLRCAGGAPVDLAEVIHRRTGGNALFLVALLDHLLGRGLLVESPAGWRLEASLEEVEAEVPESLRQMIGHQIDRLGPDEVRLLEAASVVGSEFSATAVAAGLERRVLSVEARLDVLARKRQFIEARGLAKAPAGGVTGRFEFLHALYQAVLYERVPDAQRTRLHARIGRYLEEVGAAPAQLAHHFHQAAPTGTARKAFDYARSAGDAVSHLAFEEAIGHYDMALAALELDPGATRIELLGVLLDRGETQQRAGRYAAARESFGRSLELARALGTPELFARAALGLGASHQPIGRVEESLVRLLEEALERLDPGDSGYRAMALARLAYALYYAPETRRRRAELCDEAVAMARRAGDSRALVWVRQYARWALWTPANLAQRRARVGELVELADRLGDRGHQVTAHASRLIDALEAADIATVDEEIEAFARLAEESRQPWFVWSVLRFQALRALLDGRLDEAERFAEEGLRVGQRFENPDVIPLYGAQIAMLRAQQGRAGELEPVVLPLVEQHPGLPSWRCFLAYLYCQAGRLDDGRAHFEVVAADDFAGLPEDNMLLSSLSLLAEACARLEDARRAATLYEVLAPYAEQCVVLSFGVACRGAVSRYLGMLAATRGRWREAERHFEHALQLHERMGARPWVASTQHDYARMLLKRHATGPRRKRGLALAREALATARELGLDGITSGLPPDLR